MHFRGLEPSAPAAPEEIRPGPPDHEAGGSYEKLAEMAHILQLSPKELARGQLKVPAFRALYLDSVLSGGEELDVTRDRQFRSLIRNF